MSLPRVAVATCRALPELVRAERLLPRAMEDEGLEPVLAVWDDPAFPWDEMDGVLVRTTWDYTEHYESFLAWIDSFRRPGRPPLFNPPDVLEANVDKRYLRELQEKGAPVVPTAWLKRGGQASLEALLARRGWERAVVKPRISAAGRSTWRVRRGEEGAREKLAGILAAGDALVQPYMEQVESEGEWSFVFLAGSFSHALRKVAAPGDFLVQEEHGGTVHHEPAPAPGLVEQASAILELVPGPLLYARVDGVVAGDRLLLMELELVEPELFFDAGPGSARRLARALRSRLEAIEGADSPRRTAGVYPPLPGNEERAR